MAIIKTLDILLRGRTEQFGKDLKRGSRMADTFAMRLKKSFGQFAGALGAVGLGLGFARLAQFTIRAASAAEQAAVSYQVLTGSLETGLATIKKLKGFSDFTPFTTREIQDVGKILLASGVAVDDLTKKLSFLGDASAAIGQPLREVAQIYGKIRATGKLTGETMQQLRERFINLQPAIMEIMNLDTGEAFLKAQAAGKITADIIDQAFQKMAASGGMFFGAMDKLSETFAGRLSTLTSRFETLAGTIGGPVIDAMNSFMGIIIETGEAIGKFASTGLGKMTFGFFKAAIAILALQKAIVLLNAAWLVLQARLFVVMFHLRALSVTATTTTGVLTVMTKRLLALAAAYHAVKFGIDAVTDAWNNRHAAWQKRDADRRKEIRARRTLNAQRERHTKLQEQLSAGPKMANVGTAKAGSQEAIKTIFGVQVKGPMETLVSQGEKQQRTLEQIRDQRREALRERAERVGKI